LLLLGGFGTRQNGVQVLQERMQIGWQRAETGAHVQQILSRLAAGEFLRQYLTVRSALFAQLLGFGFECGI